MFPETKTSLVLYALVSLRTGMTPLLAIDGESAKRVVFCDAKLPSIAELFLRGTQTHALGPPCAALRRNNAIALRAVFRPIASMGHALVMSAELVFRARDIADFDPGIWNPAHQ
jgi:hypothetical protein